MTCLPTCTTEDTILEERLIARFKANELWKLVLTLHRGTGVAYVAAFFNAQPDRAIYLATIDNLSQPAVFTDEKALFAKLMAEYVGTPIDIRPV